MLLHVAPHLSSLKCKCFCIGRNEEDGQKKEEERGNEIYPKRIPTT